MQANYNIQHGLACCGTCRCAMKNLNNTYTCIAGPCEVRVDVLGICFDYIARSTSRESYS